jgi:cysteine desulfurase
MNPIYLDYAATTPMDSRVAEKMLGFLTQTGDFGNASSSHCYGRRAASAIEIAREHTAKLINAQPQEIIWTSGATEANNLAIKGISQARHNTSKHIITYLSEHSGVIDSCKYLEKNGVKVTYLNPELNGLINLEKLANAIQDDTLLISVMHVNNETGIVQDMAALSELTRNKNILLHMDATQSAGKIMLDAKKTPVDLLSFSAHKVYGPKGIGALYINQSSNIYLQSQLHGGGQEKGLRSGTLPTHQIAGMGEAFCIAREEMISEIARIEYLQSRFLSGLYQLGGVHLHGDERARVPHIVNVSFDNVDIKLLIPALKEFAFSIGSACHAGSNQPSHVLQSMGVSHERAMNALRFSFGRFTQEFEIDFAIERITEVIKTLRGLS